jgi:GT2 family glycosyltransferase/glycosyltransferase involved in cell wall biosynthesis
MTLTAIQGVEVEGMKIMTARQKSRRDRRPSKNEYPIKNKYAIRKAPRFSVILCTYNRRTLVLSALASLRRQTLPYDQFEVIVVDNGSSDGTLDAVRSYIGAGQHEQKQLDQTWRVQCLYEPQNGLAYARNTGLLAASGEIAVFLDDDALAAPHFLERLSIAFDRTGADAIGGRVELRWEGARPHWLSDELLELLGYFAPASPQTDVHTFASTNFSAKIEALRAIGYFCPFISKRMDMPASIEVHDLCNRLRHAGYTLRYEPETLVEHRILQARLTRPFFVGRAYWQGRSEILMQYADPKPYEATIPLTSQSLALEGQVHNAAPLLRAIAHELRQITHMALLQRPLLRLAGRSTNEQLLAAMEQARSWGRLQQQLQFFEHAPVELSNPDVLFVCSPELDPTAELLVQSLVSQDIRCTVVHTDIPLSWLWQHRAYNRRSIGILHFHRPGALHLTHRQRQRLGFRLWLAHHLGIRVVTTDAGGWWQSARGLRFLSRRIFERKLLRHSDMILASTRQPEALYPDKRLRKRVHCLPLAGFQGHYPPPVARTEALKQLGLDAQKGFTFLCLASMHTEQELLFLIEGFREVSKNRKTVSPQLLLVGSSEGNKTAPRILQRAALNPAIHLALAAPNKEDIALYMGAVDALVLPHFAIQRSGTLETALLGLSYGHLVVAPRLPRFSGMLPPRASIFYEPGSRASLANALTKAQKLFFAISKEESPSLDAASGWQQYAQRLVKLYRQLLG